jgi:AcrR family transcriptional regulator
VPKRVDRAARREQILAAVVKVFARKGFAASRIEDVAAEAGIAKGGVYLYFESRDALLESVFSAYAAQTKTLLASAPNTRHCSRNRPGRRRCRCRRTHP